MRDHDSVADATLALGAEPGPMLRPERWAPRGAGAVALPRRLRA